jgi:hypothetical protein
MILPSLGIFAFAGIIYGKPVYEKTETIPLDGTPKNLIISDVLKAGNDYDIKMEYNVEPIKRDPPTSTFQIQMIAVITPGPIADTILSKTTTENTKFNETSEYNFAPANSNKNYYEFPDDLTADVTLNFTFKVLSAIDIESITFRIRIYANPNRALVDRLNQIGLILLIPGIIVLVIAACIAGPSNKSGRSRPTSVIRRGRA